MSTARLQALFVFLAGVDLASTLLLASGPWIEINPVAAYVARHAGWSGICMLKTASVLLALAVAGLARLAGRPALGSKLLEVGCWMTGFAVWEGVQVWFWVLLVP